MRRTLAVSAVAVSAVSFVLPAAALPALQLAWRASPESLGLVLGAGIVGAGIAARIVSGAVSRLGSRRAVALASAGVAISCLAFVEAPVAGGAAVAALALGLTGGLLEATAQRHALRTGAHGSGALMQLAFVAGTILGPVAIGWLVHTSVGWKGPFIATALMAGAIAGGSALAGRAWPATWADDGGDPPGPPLPWSATIAGFCVAAAVGAPVVLSSWLVYYLVVAKGLTWFPSVVALGLFWGTLAVGRLACQWIATHVSTPTLLWTSALVAAAAFGSLPFVSDQRWLFVGIALAGLGSAPQLPLLVAWMGSRWNADPSPVSAVLATSADVWAAAGVLVIGVIAARTQAPVLSLFGVGPLHLHELSVGILALAAAMLTISLLFRVAMRREHRSAHPEPADADPDMAAAM